MKVKRQALQRFALFCLVLCCAMALAAAASPAQAGTRLNWKVLSRQMRVGKNKQGKITDHQIFFPIQYTNNSDNERRIVKIYDRKIWLTGVLEVTVPPQLSQDGNFPIYGTGGKKRISFKYYEAFPKALDVDIFPGRAVKKNYFCWLKAEARFKGYSPNYTYKLISLDVKHDYKYRSEEI